jgi:hypothetical protein
MVIGGMVALQQRFKATEQVFQTQVGADAFVERVFVKDHVKACWLSLQVRPNDTRPPLDHLERSVAISFRREIPAALWASQ